MVCLLLLFIIHPHQQLESYSFVKHLLSDTNSLWKLEAAVDNGQVLEVMKSCNDPEKLIQQQLPISFHSNANSFCHSFHIVAISGTGHYLRPFKPTTTPQPPFIMISSYTGADFYPRYRLRASYRRQA